MKAHLFSIATLVLAAVATSAVAADILLDEPGMTFVIFDHHDIDCLMITHRYFHLAIRSARSGEKPILRRAPISLQ